MHLLEALTGRRVEVTLVDRWVRGETLYRNVTLEPTDESQPLAWAQARVELGDLDPQYARELRDRDIGIGKLFRQERFETFRELEDYDFLRNEDRLPSFVDTDGDVMLTRIYKVYHAGTDVMEITEYFPKDGFEEYLSS